jgi:hypothetical protein
MTSLLKRKPDIRATFLLHVSKITKLHVSGLPQRSIENFYIECYAGKKLVARVDPREISEHHHIVFDREEKIHTNLFYLYACALCAPSDFYGN